MIMNATGNPSRDTVLDDILYYIDHNFRSNIKLEGIAPLFGYSSAYLGKIFNKTMGESFNSYVDHRRIDYSKELLKENRLKVYEIAGQVGYNNVDYFHKKFKKYTGMSPAEYRKNGFTPPLKICLKQTDGAPERMKTLRLFLKLPHPYRKKNRQSFIFPSVSTVTVHTPFSRLNSSATGTFISSKPAPAFIGISMEIPSDASGVTVSFIFPSSSAYKVNVVSSGALSKQKSR